MAFLDVESQKEIEAAIAEAESHSAGEIVLAVLPQSDAWHAHRGTAAVVAMFITVLGLHCGAPWLSPVELFLAQVLVGLVWWWAFGRSRLLAMLMTQAQARHAVEQQAYLIFSKHGIYRTRDRSGLLIVISEMERHVVILGDEGIHAHVKPEYWQEKVDSLLAGIRSNNAKTSLLQIIGDVSDILQRNYPRRGDDENELPNSIVRDV